MKQKLAILLWLSCMVISAKAQRTVNGRVINEQSREPVSGASIMLADSSAYVISDFDGNFSISVKTGYVLYISSAGFEKKKVTVNESSYLLVLVSPLQVEMDAVVVTGTMKAVKRSESPVAVEVYTPQFLKKNPAPSIFESLQNVNGVRPQLNCSVCNTGDIHINGLEGPYTMITIDGMPIVSSLASVYGLFGIPTQLIERVEVVKGPASGLYGSEAIGGLINIITKSPDKAPLFTANLMSTSWREHNFDAGVRFRSGKNSTTLLGVNYFNYQHPFDKNNDQFTDVALQHRISVFSKTNFKRQYNRTASLAGRYFYEDRWGGDRNWNKNFRGTDSVYGESIYTSRWELIGNYQVPSAEKIMLSFSATGHQQNSYYGTTAYMGDQKIAFIQLTWDKTAGNTHSLLAGLTNRYNYYDDNSTATLDTLTGNNRADKTFIPGIFLQDEWKPGAKHLLLMGLRYDRHPVHKGIITPRLAWKWSVKDGQVFRLNAGTGFRVVSLFTEEHAALTGARAVEVQESLKPERSYNVNLNYTWFRKWQEFSLNLDASAWYSHFTNQIIPDYDTDPNKIIYKNLDGFAGSKGFSLNIEMNHANRLKGVMGITIQDVQKTERDETGKRSTIRPVLTERWSGTWAITYTIPSIAFTIDYTGNVYGPMRLPLLSSTDPRPGYSPVWSLQNIQFSKIISRQIELFAGVKNLLNWTPAKNVPFLIARSHDPFDKQVEYNTDGSVKATAENPFALTFDPSYVYAPNQGIRLFAGMRWTIK
jgi:outer membrane receptor for ferrienterochelin and colicins